MSSSHLSPLEALEEEVKQRVRIRSAAIKACIDVGCVGDDEIGCTRDDVIIPREEWCSMCLLSDALRLAKGSK